MFQIVHKLALLVSLTLMWSVAEADLPEPGGSSTSSIISEIGKLERDQDPKCYATASRLEDFMFGTPLTFAARAKKNLLHAALVREIWGTASLHSERDGLLRAKDIRDAASFILKYEQGKDGHWLVRFRGFEPIKINATDKRQYSSVAYSLRAILSVQQAIILDNEPSYQTLGTDAIQQLKDIADLFALSVLKVADNASRLEDQREVSEDLLSSVWSELKGQDTKVASAGTVATARQGQSLDLQMQVIIEKVESYKAYNEISNTLFIRNLQVYFARKRWPETPEAAAEFTEHFQRGLVAWTANLYLLAEAEAKQASASRLSEVNVQNALDVELPFLINTYEDVVYFPDLGPQEQQQIESYDIDAFRDSGIHWRYLQFALERLGDRVELAADPFSLELLTEAIANAGVLMLRLSGQEGERGDRLSVADLNRAFQRMIELRDLNQKPRNERTVNTSPPSIVSSRNDTERFEHWFEEATVESRLSYAHRSSDWLSRQIRSYLRKDEATGIITIPPAFGGAGIAAGDFDDDGLDDLLVLGGLGNRLYRNLGDRTFKDKTDYAGVNWLRPDGNPGEPRQPLVADLDNDGDQDIVITYVNDSHRVYRNDGNWRFTDVTASANLGGEELVGGPATLFDFDNDGLLDIYVTYFGNYLQGDLPTLARRNDNGSPNQLFRNLGGFRFKNVTQAAGVADKGWSQTAGHADFDGDGVQDLFSGNDFGVNRFYRNNGDGTFSDWGAKLGAQKPSYTMGLTLSDLNQDGQVDFYVSNIVTMNKDQKYVLPSEDTNMVFDPDSLANQRVVEANDMFMSSQLNDEVRYQLSDVVGRGYSSTGWSWGAMFFDPDLDGDDDLFVLNGMNEYLLYSSENPYYQDPEGAAREVTLPSGVLEENVFFLNTSGKLQNQSRNSGLNFSGNSRSAVALDLEDDGDLDIVTLDYHGPLRVFRNTLAERESDSDKAINRLFLVRLEGDPDERINRDAVGAQVILKLNDGRALWRQVSSTEGYMAVPSKLLRFGLGSASPENLRVIWPNGDVQTKVLSTGQRQVTLKYEAK